MLIPAISQAIPAEILLIRHAEKPVDDNDRHLSERGRQRAQAMVEFFQTDSRMTTYGVPVEIFAAAPRSATGSLRAIETVTPLANALKRDIRIEYTSYDYQALAEEIRNNPKFEGKTVLVSFVRDEIPELVQAFGLTNCPQEWPKTTFDRVWRIRISANGLSVCENLPQRLLPGDSQE